MICKQKYKIYVCGACCATHAKKKKKKNQQTTLYSGTHKFCIILFAECLHISAFQILISLQHSSPNPIYSSFYATFILH